MGPLYTGRRCPLIVFPVVLQDKEEIQERKKAYKEKEKADKALRKQREEEAAAKDYGLLDNTEAMMSNLDFEATEDASAAVDYEDDFM